MILVSPLDTVDQLDMLQVHELRRENGKEVVLFMCRCIKKSSQIYADSMPNQVGLKKLNLQIIVILELSHILKTIKQLMGTQEFS